MAVTDANLVLGRLLPEYVSDFFKRNYSHLFIKVACFLLSSVQFSVALNGLFHPHRS